MPSSYPADIPADVIDAAIEWAIRLDFNAPTADTRQAFERWLQVAPLHREAWRRMQALQTNFAGVPPLLALDTLQAATQIRRRSVALQRRQMLKLLALSAAAAGAGWHARNALPWQRVVADASTGVGEQRRMTLDDGTLLALNTDTAIDHDRQSHQVRLRRGELFVARALQGEPLRVRTPFGELEAAFARFVVRLAPDHALLSVREGQLRLHPGELAGAPVLAGIGESWRFGAGGVRRAGRLQFDPAGWLDGVIAARDMRLADFLAELARYRQGHIGCDPRVVDLPVSGVYHVRDTDRALQLLAQTQSLHLRFRTRFWVSVEPANGADDLAGKIV